METVICHCLKCKAELGRFRNSWNGIGNTYFSPVRPPISVSGFAITGDIYEAAPGSQIEDSLLQDLACGQCQSVLGLRCDSAPEGHLLHHNQMILRLAEMTVVSEGPGTKAKISIMKTFPLTKSSVGGRNLSASRRGSTSQPISRPKPPRFLPGLSRMSSPTSRLSTPISTPPQLDVAEFKTWAEDAIKQQQQDINRLSGSLGRIERDMQLFKDFMEEVRTSLASHLHPQLQSNEESLAGVREELVGLRQQLNLNHARPVSRGSFEMSRKSLEVIAKDVQLVGQKVDEIDTLKRELAQLKGQLSSLESPIGTGAAATTRVTEEMPIGVRETRSRRKRNHSQIDVVEATSQLARSRSPELPTKRRRTRNMPASTEVSAAAANSVEGRNRRAGARERRKEEISSSDAIPGEADRQGHFNYVEDEVDNNYQPPQPATPVPTFLCPGGEGTTDNASRTDLASLPLSERIMRLKTVIEPGNSTRKKDIMMGRKRAPNGLLLTKDGKVDRRSLRGLSFHGDEENQPPSRSSLAPETSQNRAEEIVNQQLWDPFGLPVLPSVEQFESALQPHSTPQHRSSSSNFSITPRDPKPFSCGSCEKRYVARSGLQYHMKNAKNSACKSGVGNGWPEGFTCDMCSKTFCDMQKLDGHICRGELTTKIVLEDRERSLALREASVAVFEATLADREQLVRQTLEREMTEAVRDYPW